MGGRVPDGLLPRDSAFDMHYGLCPTPEDMPLNLAITVIDSGGYEISDHDDLSSVYSAAARAEDWDRSKLRSVLDRWPSDRDALLVSFDHPAERHPFAEQVRHAADMAKSYPHQLHTSAALSPRRGSQAQSSEGSPESTPSPTSNRSPDSTSSALRRRSLRIPPSSG